MKVLVVLLGLLAVCLTVTKNDSNFLWPRPMSYSYDDEGEDIPESPCNITYVVHAEDKVYIQQMLSYYLVSVFQCKSIVQGKTLLSINVTHGGQFIATEKKH